MLKVLLHFPCFLFNLNKQELAVFSLFPCLHHSIQQADHCPKYHRVNTGLFLIWEHQIRLSNLLNQNLESSQVSLLGVVVRSILSNFDQPCSCGFSLALLVLFSTVSLFQTIIIQGILYTVSV